MTIRIPKAALIAFGFLLAIAAGVVGTLMVVDDDDNGSPKTRRATTGPPYRVPTDSMLPTYRTGDLLTTDLNVAGGRDLEIGDVVVFYAPAGAEENTCGVTHLPDQPCPRPTRNRSDLLFLKRIVAKDGDTVAIRDGRTILNGELQEEPFIEPCGGGGQCSFPRPARVPKDHFFVLGDNRGESDDSRFWGPVSGRWIAARVSGRRARRQ